MRWKSSAALMVAAVLMNGPVPGTDLEEIRSLIEQGRTAEALGGLDEYLEENPADSGAMFLRGLALAESRQERSARSVFEELAEMEPQRAEPLNNLAVVQASMGEYEAAVETLKAALRTEPAYRVVYENLTKIYGQLASEAYSRALNVTQGHDRSAVELTLLSEMDIPTMATTLIAAAETAEPAEPMAPSVAMPAPTSEIFTEVAEVPAESDDEPAVPVAEAPAVEAETPDEAIAETLAREEFASEPLVSDPPGTGTEETAVAPADLANLVEAWARAWSEQRVDNYLSFYSSSFLPADGASRTEWERQRRERVARPEHVKVSVAFLDFEIDSTESALVRFNQSYESDTFSDIVTKTLELTREAAEWKILRETVEAVP